MIGSSPPLRFLLLVAGGWVCVRGAVLALHDSVVAPPSTVRVSPSRTRFAEPEAVLHQPAAGRAARAMARLVPRPVPLERAQPAVRIERRNSNPPLAQTLPVALRAPVVMVLPGGPPGAARVPPIIALPAPLERATPNRWSAAAWTLVRRGGGGALAPGGTLGGSQAGARISYSLTNSVAVTARAYAPLDRPHGAEAAIGVEWQPLRRVPIRLLAERRQRIGSEGRSDFALTAHGGISEARLPADLRIDAYGQAGVVGLQRHDLFADGAARISARLGSFDIGGGVWAAAQPGAARLDVGPSLGLRLPVAGTALRASADWRFRVAGDAAPGSGPSLTVGTDF